MRVLIADDSALSRRLVAQRLTGWGYEVIPCADGNEALRTLEGQDPPPVAILDWDMPGLSGVEVCRRIRAAGKEPYTYMIILTAHEEKEALVEGLESGADDFLRKPFDDGELRARLHIAQRTTDLQADLIATRERLRVQVTHDALTGLWSRGAILEFFDREVARAHRERRTLAAVLIELDPFKFSTDPGKRLTRDTVVREAGNRIRVSLRSYDTVGRHGGEQFLVVIAGCDAEVSARRAEQIRAAVAQRPIELSGVSLALTCSGGLIVGPTGEMPDPSAMLRKADEALQLAKKLGRNRVEIAPS